MLNLTWDTTSTNPVGIYEDCVITHIAVVNNIKFTIEENHSEGKDSRECYIYLYLSPLNIPNSLKQSHYDVAQLFRASSWFVDETSTIEKVKEIAQDIARVLC